jgi:putative SOS response-associated peptidase YedK
MCGRFDQNETASHYASTFGWADAVYEGERGQRFNVSPGTYVPVMRLAGEERRIDDVYWSYRAGWVMKREPAPGQRRLPIAVNAKLEKIMGSYWKPLMRGGRCVVAASGWYEWTGEKGAKQPWHIHRKDREPIFMLALANFGPAGERPEETGFALVTADAEGGMVDIHDRRPVVLRAADAQLWLDPGLSPEQAAELARQAALGPDEFEWFAVSPAMNRAGVEGAELIEPASR